MRRAHRGAASGPAPDAAVRDRLPRAVRALAVIHPFPSAVNAALVAALATLAGGAPIPAALLAAGMFALQASIGATNDLFDEDADALVKPAKPIPAGVISRPAAALVAVAGALAAIGVGLLHGSVVTLLVVGMLLAGLTYDAVLKRTPFGWVAYAIAFPMLPVYAWIGAAGVMPPRWELLLPVASLAGPTLAVANGLVDVDRDRRAGIRGVAVVLGRRRAVALLATLHGVVFVIAWSSLVATGTTAPLGALVLTAVATAAASLGVAASASSSAARRERGWEAQTVAVAFLGAGWLLAALPG